MPIFASNKQHAQITEHTKHKDTGSNLFIAMEGIMGKRLRFRLGDMLDVKQVCAVGIYSVYQLENMKPVQPTYTMMPDMVIQMFQTPIMARVVYTGNRFSVNVFSASLPLSRIWDFQVRKAVKTDGYGAVASIMNKLPPNKNFATRLMREGALEGDTRDMWISIYGPHSRNAPRFRLLRSFKFGATFESSGRAKSKDD